MTRLAYALIIIIAGVFANEARTAECLSTQVKYDYLRKKTYACDCERAGTIRLPKATLTEQSKSTIFMSTSRESGPVVAMCDAKSKSNKDPIFFTFAGWCKGYSSKEWKNDFKSDTSILTPDMDNICWKYGNKASAANTSTAPSTTASTTTTAVVAPIVTAADCTTNQYFATGKCNSCSAGEKVSPDKSGCMPNCGENAYWKGDLKSGKIISKNCAPCSGKEVVVDTGDKTQVVLRIQ